MDHPKADANESSAGREPEGGGESPPVVAPDAERTEQTSPPSDQPTARQSRTRHLNVDAPVSSVVHLLGVAKASDLEHLHSKIDLLLSRQEADHNKLLELSAAVSGSSPLGALERMSVQLAQALALLRQFGKKLGIE